MNEQRIGDWILTYTGKKFWPLDPRVAEICIEDIAHALANTCRFGGHCKAFYSVAQHSLLVSRFCTEAPLQGLMHDAAEAYIGDMVRPLKQDMPDFRRVEESIWRAICGKFDLEPRLHAEVKEMDNVALVTERRDLLSAAADRWALEEHYKPVFGSIHPMIPYAAELAFLVRFKELTNLL